MSDTKVSLFKELFPVSAIPYKLSQEKYIVKLKLLNEWGDRTVHDLTKLVGLFGVPGDHLHLSTVEQGCIAVTWLCSSTYIKELKGAIVNVTDVLQTKGVLQIFIGEELVLECPHHDQGTAHNHIIHMNIITMCTLYTYAQQSDVFGFISMLYCCYPVHMHAQQATITMEISLGINFYGCLRICEI